jgi:hypothetical protein
MIARYYFHLHDGKFVADRDGTEFADWTGASGHAVVRAGAAIAARGASFWKGEHLRIVVTDSVGTALFELRLSGHRPLTPNVLGPDELGPIN